MAPSTSYGELLKDPRWQRRRLEILERDNWTCQACTSTDKTLHVHHKFYLSGKTPWEYENDNLVTLCLDCHEQATNSMALLRVGLARLGPEHHEQLRGYVDALVSYATGSKLELQSPRSSEDPVFRYLNGVSDAMGWDNVNCLTVCLDRRPEASPLLITSSEIQDRKMDEWRELDRNETEVYAKAKAWDEEHGGNQ